MTTKKPSTKKTDKASPWMKHLDRVVETIAEGVLIVGPDGKFGFANPAAERILGATQKQIIGRTFRTAPWKAVSIPGESPIPEEQMPTPRAFATGKTVGGVEFAVKRADGDVVWVSANAVPVKDPSGKVAAVVASFTDVTERKHAEDAVRASRERYRSFVQNFHGVAFQGTLDGESEFFHGPVEEMTGYTEEDFRTGKIRWHELVHPDDAADVLKDAEKMRSAPGYSSEREFRTVRRDGGVRWVHGSIRCVPGRHGKPLRVQGAFYDITDRKQAEQALAESEERYRTMIEFSNDLIWTLDTEGNFTYFNKKAEEVSGYKFSDWQGKSFAPTLRPEDLPRIQEMFLDTLAGHARTYEVDVRRQDGSVFTLSANSTPIYESGRIVGTASFGRDITAQKDAENALSESEARYRTLAETAQDVIFIVDRAGEVKYVNNAGAKFYGVPPDTIAGTALARMFPTQVMEHASSEVRDVFESGEPARVRNRVRFPGGEAWLDTTLTPMKSETGDVSGVMGISHDITEMKKAEEKLQEKDRDIRQAYVDVIGAVTGNRLVLMTPDEIDGALGGSLADPGTVTSYEELSNARAEIRRVFTRSLPQVESIDEFIVGVCEALTNAVKHAGGGSYQVFRCGKKTAQVAISDNGPGIDFKNLPKATLEMGFSTAHTLGVGFTLMLDLSDRVLLSTQKGNTTVVLEVSK